MIRATTRAAALLLLAGCGDDPATSAGDAGDGSAGASEGEGEGEGEGESPVECTLGQVLREGRCLDPCGTNGPVCDPDTELCVRFEGAISCRSKCGRLTGHCDVGSICHVVAEEAATEGFCAEGTCPEGSHPGVEGWCVCDTGDIPPPDLPCRVELCGLGNPNGHCLDPNQICVNGRCR